MQNDLNRASDEEIIHCVLNGDVNAFAYLLIRYKNHVHRIVCRHVPYDEVEDMCQDVFMRAYQSLPNYRKEGKFKQWLSQIAVRTCYDFWRRRYRSQEIPIGSLSSDHENWLEEAITEESSNSFLQKGKEGEARELLDWALRKLSPEDRMVLELVYLEKFSIKETSQLMGWSMVNVKVRAFRARRKLKEIFKEIWEG